MKVKFAKSTLEFPYKFHDKLILRNPRYSNSIKITEEEIRSKLYDDTFLEALYLASPNLYRQAINWKESGFDEINKKDKLVYSLTKYLVRMTARCTPFGMFAGCSVSNWSNTNTTINIDGFERNTRLDMYYLCELIQAISEIPVINAELIYFANSSIYAVADEIRYVEYKFNNDKRVHTLNAVENSPVLQDIFSQAVTGIKKWKIKEIIRKHVGDDFTDEEVLEYIDDLIESQLLISELEPTITNPDSLRTLVRIVEKIQREINTEEVASLINTLLNVIEDLIKLDEQVVNKIESYQSISDALRTIDVTFNESKLFQTDLAFISSEAKVENTLQVEIVKTLQVLNKLTASTKNKDLSSFVERFLKRYKDKEISLLEALDTETGIGYGDKVGHDPSVILDDLPIEISKEKQIQFDQIKALKLDLLIKANAADSYTIDFTNVDLDHLDENWSDCPPSFAVMFKVLADGKSIFLESAGNSSAINLLGRFAHTSKAIKQVIDEIVAEENQQNSEVLFAEIVHLPESRVGNILQHPVFRSYEIPYLAKSSLDGNQVIRPEDLKILIRNEKIYLKSTKLDRYIIPRLSNAHNFSSKKSLPIYKFLGDLQSQDEREAFGFEWGDLGTNFKFYPRVIYQKNILHPAMWKLNAEDIEMLRHIKGQTSSQEIEQFRTHWNMPQCVLLADGDNELLIDFGNHLMVNVLIDTLKNKSSFTIKEYLPGINEITDDKGNKYEHQFIGMLQKNTACYAGFPDGKLTKTDETEIVRKFEPGSEWIYYKVYCGSKQADNLLAETLNPLIRELQDNQLIDQWFFIRFHDPDHHLRIRLHLTNKENFTEVISRFQQVINPRLQNDQIWSASLDTYERELMRYGKNTIELFESLFFADSEILTDMLSMTWGDGREQIRWLWCLSSIDAYLNGLNFSTKRKMDFMEILKDGFAEEFGVEKVLKLGMDKKYRLVRPEIDGILNRDESLIGEFSPIFDLLDERSKMIQPLLNQLLFLETKDELMLDLNNLMESFIHMLMNRMFSSRQREYELVLYDYLFRAYKSSVAKEKKR